MDDVTMRLTLPNTFGRPHLLTLRVDARTAPEWRHGLRRAFEGRRWDAEEARRAVEIVARTWDGWAAGRVVASSLYVWTPSLKNPPDEAFAESVYADRRRREEARGSALHEAWWKEDAER